MSRGGRALAFTLAFALALLVPASAFATQVFVTTTADVVDGNTTSLTALNAAKGPDNAISLREAVLALRGETVPAEIVLGGSAYVLEDHTTIVSVGVAPSVLGGSLPVVSSVRIVGAGSTISPRVPAAIRDRIFDVDPALVGGVSFQLDDATLVNGCASGAFGGGAIRAGGAASHTSVTLNRCVLASNSATPGADAASSGGALSIGDNVDLRLQSCFLNGNSAVGVGGAIFVADTGSGTINIGGSTFTNNVSDGGSAFAGQGGAIYAHAGGGSSIATSTFTGNVAQSAGSFGPDRGGALFIGGTAVIRDSRIATNVADEGPGAYGFLGTPDAKYNWWGRNSSPMTGSPVQVAGGIDADQWMRLTVAPTTAEILRGGSVALSAHVGNAGHVPPNDVNVAAVPFAAASLGTVAPGSDALNGGVANSTFTAGAIGGLAPITATYDSAVATCAVGVLHEPSITAASEAVFTVGANGAVGVSAEGYHVPTISLSGSLPSGLAFSFTGSIGTTTSAATIAGKPAAHTGGKYHVSVVATNGIAPDASASMTVTVLEAPSFTSASATTVTVGSAASFSVVTTGYPVATIGSTGGLPTGLTLTDNGDGTASISGTPSGPGGVYAISLQANNGVSPAAHQAFTICVRHQPEGLDAHDASFTVGAASTTTFTADGYPLPALSLTGALPSGLTFATRGSVGATTSAATINGQPGAGTGGRYPVTLHAGNGIGADASAPATITVVEAPTVGAADVTATAGDAVSIDVSSTGFPIAHLSATGTLPSGVAFADNGDGTGTFSGTLGRKSGGVFPITLSADNGASAPASRVITITVLQPTPVWASRQFTWDTQADFEHNASTIDATTTIAGGASATRISGSVVNSRVTTIAAGQDFTLALKSDGTVAAIGSNTYGACNVSGWSNVTAIAAGTSHSVALKSDGTVVATGSNGSGECNVSGWSDITAIAAGEAFTVGLKSDGTVVAVGNGVRGQRNVSGWSGVTAIAAGVDHTVGLKSNGTVVVAGPNVAGECNVSAWTGITSIAAGSYYTVGLKSDGTVMATGWNDDGQCNVAGWSGITAISAGYFHTLGLKSDGTVVAAGNDMYGQCNVSGWSGITAISAGYFHTLGLKSDGTVATGSNGSGQCDVSGLPVGTVGGTGAEVGLRAVADSSLSAWGSIVASSSALSSGGAVKFGVRLSGDGVSWTPMLGADGNPIDWTTGSGNYLGAAFGETPRTDLSALPKSRYIDIMVRIESGASDVELKGVSVTHDRDDLIAPTAIDDAPSGWRNADTTVTVTATDTLSGVAALDVAVSPDAPVTSVDTGTALVGISAEGTTTIAYSATDDAGNRCATQTPTVRIDKSAPGLAVSASLASLSLDATDAVSGIAGVWYSVDGGPTQLCTGAPISPGASGTHVIVAWAQDVAGNITVKSAVVSVDTQAPTASDDAPIGWQSTDTTVTMTAHDTETGIGSIDWLLGGASAPTAGSSAVSPAGALVTAEGTTTVDYSAADGAGNRCATQTATVRVDKTAPVSQATYASGWQHGPVTVMLSATDALSGVGSIWYRTNPAAAWTLYTAPFQVAEEGASSVQFRAYDVAGNAEDPRTATVQIDNTAPACADDAPTGWINHPWQLQWSATDALSGVSAMDADYSGAYVWHNLHVTWSGASNYISQDGTTTLVFTATDAVGNTSAPHTATLRIDRTAPSTTATHTSGWSSVLVTVSLAATDPISGVAATYYRLGSSPTALTYSGPFTIGASGSTTVTYWSVDAAGNIETPKTTTVQVDDHAPSVSDDAPSGWQTSAVDVNLYAIATPSGIGSIDDTVTAPSIITTASTAGADTTVHVADEGTTTIEYSAVSSAGNRSDTHAATVRIDSGAPSTTTSHTSGWSATPVTVSLDASDAVSGVAATWYRVGKGGKTLYEGPFEIDAAGETVVTYWSVDAAGNAETAKTTAVRIDVGGPTVTDAASAAWQRGPVVVWLHAADAAAGVGSLDWVATDASGAATSGSASSADATFSVSAEGTNTIAYSAADALGNRCATQTATLRIDNSSPVTTDDHVASYVGGAQISLVASDALSGVASTGWTLDGVAGTGSLVATSAVGNHTLQYASTDVAGNREETRSATFEVKPLTTPAIESTLVGPNLWGKASSNKLIRFGGQIRPAHATAVVIEIQWLVKKKYRGYKTFAVSTNNAGVFSFKIKLKKGTYRLRASAPPRKDYAAARLTKWNTVRVR